MGTTVDADQLVLVLGFRNSMLGDSFSGVFITCIWKGIVECHWLWLIDLLLKVYI